MKSEKGAIPVLALIVLAILSIFIYKVVKTPALPASLTTTQAQVIPLAIPNTSKTDQTSLKKYLTVEAALLGIYDNMSLYFKDLTDSSKEVAIDPTRSWIPASTIKAFVVLEAFRQRNIGLINFDTPVTIKADNVVPTEIETNDYPKLREGTVATIKQLIESMITQSDNTAYNTLLDVLDRRNINANLKSLGLTETVVGEKLNLDDDQFQEDLTVPGRQPNTTTAKDLATLFDLLYNNKVASSQEILNIFKKQKINNMIPALLPLGTVVAHKTGDWSPIYHDGGIIFKSSDPFIITIFTSSGEPSAVAELAKVAYYQNADSVGNKVSLNINPSEDERQEVISLASNNSHVLADETSSKFPTITASDLGITPQDLGATLSKGESVENAFVTPGNPLFPFKQIFESEKVNLSPNNHTKVEALISKSKDEVAEVKSMLSSNNVDGAGQVLEQSEQDLAQATALANHDPNKDELMLQVKQVNDLHYSVLADKATTLPPDDKEKFIDSVYKFVKENHAQVSQVVQNSVVANPTQQKPAIGEINDISGNTATVTFDDGTNKQMVIPDNTKVREFQQNNYTSVNDLKDGDKIAVIGVTNSDQKIVPQFILSKVPNELPSSHVGTVIEVDTQAKTLQVLDKNGNVEVVNVGAKTTIKSTDTDVSLGGIKAGSQVTVFGTTQSSVFTSTPSGSLRPTLNPNTSTEPSATPKPVGKDESSRLQYNVPNNTLAPTQIKATTITVTKNSSGSEEQSKPDKNNRSNSSGSDSKKSGKDDH